ncbi:MAG: mechanosensitive ion channel family protein [Polyangiales bacterium]
MLLGPPCLLGGLAGAAQAWQAPALHSPRQAVRHFEQQASAGHFTQAASALDLRHLTAQQRRTHGADVARKLKAVLDQTLWLDASTLPDDAAATAKTAKTRVHRLGTVPLGGRALPLLVRRIWQGGQAQWLLSGPAVSQVDALYRRHGPSLLAQQLPEGLRALPAFGDLMLWQLVALLVLAALAWLLSAFVTSLLLKGASKMAAHTESDLDDRLIAVVQGPSGLLLTLLVMFPALRPLQLALPVRQGVQQGLLVALIATCAWLAMRSVHFAVQTLERQADKRARLRGELAARGMRTQLRMLQRVADVLIVGCAAALILLQFEVVRSVGVSLLASAGVAGIVLGLAAQRSIGTLLAGIQLSLTQPVRLGDTVIVEGEWGTIEEIHLTYIVLCVWDKRRVVVPIGRFLDQSFENWTKVSPDLLGTVYLYADYRLPVDAMRQELDRLLEGNPLWDGEAKGIIVSDCTERTLQLRPLVSAADASALWDLRCQVRERLITWLQRYEGGRYLPTGRLEMQTAAPPHPAAP